MSIILTADLHADVIENQVSFNLSVKERLYWLSQCFQDIVKVARDNQAEHLVIAGDLFNNKFKITGNIISFYHSVFKQIPLQIHIISGNHDTAYLPVLNLFNELNNVTVYNKLTRVVIDNMSIVFLPWEEDLLPSLKQYKAEAGDRIKDEILISHFAARGAKPDITSVDTIGYYITLPHFGYKKIYLGDFHRHQSYLHATYIGIPFPQKLSDQDIPHVLLLQDINKEAEKINLASRYPRFIDFENISQDFTLVPGATNIDYLNISTTMGLKSQYTKMYPRTKINIQKDNMNLKNYTEGKRIRRIEFNKNKELTELIPKYTDYKQVVPEKKEKINKIGEYILKGVMQ